MLPSTTACDQPELPEAPVASHAWAEAWVVDRWQSFDVVNGGAAGELHVKLAVGAWVRQLQAQQ